MQEGLGDGPAEDERLQRLRPELRREANVQAAVHEQQGMTLSLICQLMKISSLNQVFSKLTGIIMTKIVLKHYEVA